MIKRFFIIFLFLLILPLGAIARDRDYIGLYTIDPEKNAYIHNNYGLYYLDMGYYLAAIQEFKIAISLNPETQATSIYYNNLGETYLKVGYAQYAQDCFERAIARNPLNFKFYQNLVTVYKQLGLLDSKLSYLLKNKRSPLDDVTIGLIFIEKGEINKGIATLDNFVMNEPKLFITDGVKNYLHEIIKAQKSGR